MCCESINSKQIVQIVRITTLLYYGRVPFYPVSIFYESIYVSVINIALTIAHIYPKFIYSPLCSQAARRARNLPTVSDGADVAGAATSAHEVTVEVDSGS